MRINRVRLHDNAVFLHESQDVDLLKDQIVAAARAGAGFVEFTTAGGTLITALVTAQTPVQFEHVDVSDEPHPEPAPVNQPVELYLEFGL